MLPRQSREACIKAIPSRVRNIPYPVGGAKQLLNSQNAEFRKVTTLNSLIHQRKHLDGFITTESVRSIDSPERGKATTFGLPYLSFVETSHGATTNLPVCFLAQVAHLAHLILSNYGIRPEAPLLLTKYSVRVSHPL